MHPARQSFMRMEPDELDSETDSLLNDNRPPRKKISERRPTAYAYLPEVFDEDEDDETSSGVTDRSQRPEGEVSLLSALSQMPKSIYCIIAVLLMYLISIGYSNDTATVLYHAFIVLCYFMPLLGAILSDGYLGRYRVIVYLSIVYTFGSVLLAGSSAREHTDNTWTDLIGLTIIAIGTGGIKPCVSAFGADQFVKGQEPLVEPYFSFFYAAINAGSLLSIILTPIMRTYRCLGANTCYSLSFGVPAGLMVLAIVLIVSGNVFGYRKVKPRGNVIADVWRMCWLAMRNKMKYSTKRDHWLEHSLDTHNCVLEDKCTPSLCYKAHFVEDVKGLFRVLLVYLPLPFFWALFDQQGSRWLIQTAQMDYQMGSITIPPALMQALNAILILIYIPLFQSVVYPLVRKCGIETTPLRKMVTGCFIAAFSFVLAGLVQLAVNPTLPQPPQLGTVHFNFINTLPCDLSVSSPEYNGGQALNVASNGTITDLPDLKSHYLPNVPTGVYTWSIKANPTENQSTACDLSAIPTEMTTALRQTGKVYYTVLVNNLTTIENTLMGSLEKDQQALGLFKININDFRLSASMNQSSWTLLLCRANGKKQFCDPNKPADFQEITIGKTGRRTSAFVAVKPGFWRVFDWTYRGSKSFWELTPEQLENHAVSTGAAFDVFGQGGVYTYTLYDLDNSQTTGVLYNVVPDNSVPILWQIPQFALITAAEILISVTILEFSYSQAAHSMKSVLQAANCLTTAFGNLLIVFVADSRIFDNGAYELFAFAGLMAIVSVIFMVLAIFFYEYRYYEQQAHDDTEDTTVDKVNQE